MFLDVWVGDVFVWVVCVGAWVGGVCLCVAGCGVEDVLGVVLGMLLGLLVNVGLLLQLLCMCVWEFGVLAVRLPNCCRNGDVLGAVFGVLLGLLVSVELLEELLCRCCSALFCVYSVCSS